MPSLKIELGKKNITLMVLLVAVLVVGVVYAYGTSNPVVMGHSAGEIEGTVPSGAVMAFNLASCPPGWSEYTSARDRTIVGSGSSYSRGATGGASTHTLTIAEMPAHTHGTLNGINSNNNAGAVFPAMSNINNRANVATTATGGGAAHNNMQPYIALLYCQKN